MNTSYNIATIVVTRNSERTIARTLDSLIKQSVQPKHLVVVDCASQSTAWTQRFASERWITFILSDANIGFTGANNLGWRHVENCDPEWLLFLNPDVLLPPETLARLWALGRQTRTDGFAAISPRLLEYSFEHDAPTGRIDSTGIFPRSWGRWQDRRETSPPEDRLESVPALCGAFMFCRVKALREVLRPGGGVFDERYFAYKEDIELSLRLQDAGWELGVWHGWEIFHARGWSRRRRDMPRALRLMSARNEVRLHATYQRSRLLYSLLKWIYVRWFERFRWPSTKPTT